MKANIDINGNLNVWCEDEIEVYALSAWVDKNFTYLNEDNNSPEVYKKINIECFQVMEDGIPRERSDQVYEQFKDTKLDFMKLPDVQGDENE